MKTLIAVPCMDMMHTKFVHSLFSLAMGGDHEVRFVESSLIYDSRNQIVAKAVDGDYDRLLWLDSDMTFDQTMIAYLHQDLDAGYDIVSGLCFGRKPPIRPVIFKECYLDKLDNGMLNPVSERYEDYPRDMLFEVAAFGGACVMMKVDALRRITEKFGRMLYMPIPGFGEDLSFCLRAREAGERLWCDSRAAIGHIGLKIYDEQEWLRSKNNDS